MNLIVDANALIAYLNGEAGGERVDTWLMDAQNACYVHAINICEVYYDFVRTHGEVKLGHPIHARVSTPNILRRTPKNLSR